MKRRKILNKSCGNVGDVMTMGLCVLAMTVVMGAYLDNVELIQQKTYVGQIARKYILKMETEGGMTQEDRNILMQNLEDMGITDITITGTSLGDAKYGEQILLHIRGKLKGGYEFEESRVSTAKN